MVPDGAPSGPTRAVGNVDIDARPCLGSARADAAGSLGVTDDIDSADAKAAYADGVGGAGIAIVTRGAVDAVANCVRPCGI